MHSATPSSLFGKGGRRREDECLLCPCLPQPRSSSTALLAAGIAALSGLVPPGNVCGLCVAPPLCIPNRLSGSALSSRKLIFDLRAPSCGEGCVQRVAKVLDCPDLEPGCSRAALPAGLLLQESRRLFFFFSLTLDSRLTKWLSQPDLRAPHKTSSYLMAWCGVGGTAPETCPLIDSTWEFLTCAVQLYKRCARTVR